MRSLKAGYHAFAETWLHTGGPTYSRAADWDGYPARALRYAMFRASRDNTLYDRIHTWSEPYKTAKGLYKYVRGIYNPAARLIEFHVSHIIGGPLDPAAGDGRTTPTACPIVGIPDSVRPAIATLFAASRWAAVKTLVVRDGATCGDAFLTARDDPIKQRIIIEPVDPAFMYDVQHDAAGDVIAYTRVEPRPDPDSPLNGMVEFREDCRLNVADGTITFQTFKDGKAYPWNNVASEWTLGLPFVPLWHVRHIETGTGWGESELAIGRAKFDEINDLASKLHDQLRKQVEGAHVITGAARPREIPRFDADEDTDQSPMEGRQFGKTLWIPNAEARVHSLVHDVDVQAVTAEIRQNIDSVEDDYPELRFERLRTGGSISGEALRIARQPAGLRVQERRQAYDTAIAKAIAGALSLGGLLRYAPYAAFRPDDYYGQLANLAIADRPVFQADVQDRLMEWQRRHEAILMGVNAGIPIDVTMRNVGGFSEDDIKAAAELANMRLAANMKTNATITTVQPEKAVEY